MIYLIGGAPHCGKTTLSKKLGVPWISVDTIESMVASVVKQKDYSKIFPKSVVRKQTKQSNDKMYSLYTTKQIVNLYKRQAGASWKAVEVFIECELKAGHSYALEGHQLHPVLISRIIKKFGKNNIKAVALTRFNENEITQNCVKYSNKNDWFISKTTDKAIYPKIALMIKEYSKYLDKEAKKYRIKSISVDDNFADNLKIAKSHLLN